MALQMSILGALLIVVASQASSGVSGDLSLSQYQQIEAALKLGDVGKLPDCSSNSCAPDLSALLHATQWRINWRLEQSRREAQRCLDVAPPNHVATRYTCARLANSDANNWSGYFGYRQTIDALADAVQQACVAHLWGNSGSCSTSSIVKEAVALRRMNLQEEHVIEYERGATVSLEGDGAPKAYVGTNPVSPVLNYPSAHATIDGHDVVMTIDTAAQRTSLTSATARRFGIAPIAGSKYEWTDAEGVSRTNSMAQVKSFTFANIEIRNKSVAISSDGAPSANDGVIGIDVLQRLHAFMFTPQSFVTNPPRPSGCEGHFTVSSNIYSAVFGIRPLNATFNGTSVVAILDTGNAAFDLAATWQFVNRSGIHVANVREGLTSGVGGVISSTRIGDIGGEFKYLSKVRKGMIHVAVENPTGLVDFNIGSPSLYGDDLYVNFDANRVCLFRP